MARNLLESVALLSSSTTLLSSRCVAGIAPNRARCAELIEQSLAMVTPLAVRIGYNKAANLPTRRTTGEDDPRAAFGKGGPHRGRDRPDPRPADDDLMDTVTHGLTGCLIARALPDRWKGEHPAIATAVVALGSFSRTPTTRRPCWGANCTCASTGASPIPPRVSVSSLVVALLFARFGRWKDAKRLYLLALIGQASHIVLDLLNAYGTQVLQPFSDARLSLDLLFVVDLVFTGIVVAGSPGPAAAGRPRACRDGFYRDLCGDRGAAPRTRGGPCAGCRRPIGGSRGRGVGAPAASFRAAPLHGPARFATPAVASPAQKDLPGSRAPWRKERFRFRRPLSWNGSWTTGGPSCGGRRPSAGTLEWKQRELRGPTSRRSARCAVGGRGDVSLVRPVPRGERRLRPRPHGSHLLRHAVLRDAGRGPFLLRVIETPGARPWPLGVVKRPVVRPPLPRGSAR